MRIKADAHTIVKQCVACGIDFRVILSYADQQTCSSDCDSARRRHGAPSIVTITCQWCDKQQNVAYKYRGKKYCSTSCRSKNSWNLGRTKSDCELLRRVGERGGATRVMKMLAGEYSPTVRSKQSQHVSFKTCSTHRCRSPWEAAFLMTLDIDDAVVGYVMEPFAIPYLGADMAWHRYLPDVLVEYRDGSKELIETKPSGLVSYGNNPLKHEAAMKWCSDHAMTFSVYTESELRSRGCHV